MAVRSAVNEAKSASPRRSTMSAMGRGLAAVVFVGAVVGAAIAFAQGDLATLASITPPEMKFIPNPERPGAVFAVLAGDPSKAGVYVMHLRMPANIRIEPHSHSETWRIGTVLSGTVYFGYGDKFD